MTPPQTQFNINAVMKNYEVVCTMGWNTHMIRTISAEDEKQARKIMWEAHMDDSQKDNCIDVEVFECDE